jgi:hypothetical protein
MTARVIRIDSRRQRTHILLSCVLVRHFFIGLVLDVHSTESSKRRTQILDDDHPDELKGMISPK